MRAIDSYGQGLTVDQIAVEMGVTKTTVSRRLRAAGVQMPGWWWSALSAYNLICRSAYDLTCRSAS